MRTHEQIIRDAGGYQDAAAKMDPDDKALPGRVRFWLMRKSIPADHWGLVVRAGLATPDELIQAAEAKRIAALPANDTAPASEAA